jgi:hypothetical protein
MILSRYVCGGSTSQQRIPAGSARRRRAPARNGNPSGHSHVWWGTELTELTTHRSGYGSLLPMHKKPAGGGRAELGPGIAGLRGVRFRLSQWQVIGTKGFLSASFCPATNNPAWGSNGYARRASRRSGRR